MSCHSTIPNTSGWPAPSSSEEPSVVSSYLFLLLSTSNKFLVGRVFLLLHTSDQPLTWRLRISEKENKSSPWNNQISSKVRWRRYLRARDQEDSGGAVQCILTQTMTPLLTVENTCLYLCLAASSLTLTITVFSLYVIIQRYRITGQDNHRQGVRTGQEEVPRCLTQI